MTPSPRRRFILLATAAYVLLALAWILLSDRLLEAVADVQSVVWFSTAKGIFFVLTSGAFLFLALRAVPDALARPSPGYLAHLTPDSTVPRSSQAMTFAFALVISLSGLLACHALSQNGPFHSQALLLILPIILSALLGGLWPGLLSTVVTVAGMAYLQTSQGVAPQARSASDVFALALLACNGLVTCFVGDSLRRALARLHAQRHLLEAVVSGTTDAVYAKDALGRYTLVNSAAASFIGRPSQEIIGRDDTELFPPPTGKALADITHAVMARRTTETAEESVSSYTGETRTFLVTKGPVRDLQGKVTGIFGISRDITARKAVELATQRSAQVLLDAQRLARIGNWEWDLQSGALQWSAEVYRIFGRDPAMPPANLSEMQAYFTPASWLTLVAAVDHARATGEPYACDVEVVRQDGSHAWITSRGNAEEDASGEIVRLSGTVQDITDSRRITEDLQTVLSEAGDIILISNVKTEFLYANPAATRLVGYSLDEFKAMKIPDLLDPSVHADLKAHLQLLDANQQIRREWALRRRDGSLVPMELVTKRLSDGRYIAFGRDLSERQLADARLRERERQLARVIAGSDQGYWDWDLPTNRFTVSDRWETMLGFQPGEMDVSFEHWGDHVHPDDLALAQASIERHLAGRTPSHEMEMRIRTQSGEWRWILTRGRVVAHAADGTPLTMSGTHTDITERKMLELAQREANTVFSSSYEGIMVVSAERLITKINPAFTRITGYSADEVIGQPPSILSSGRHDANFYREVWASLLKLDFWRGELWNQRKNGEVFPELLSISVVRNVHGAVEHYVGVFSDISYLKAHESELDRIAHYDPLTGLANRRLLGDRLAQAIIRSARAGKSLAVCYLDLDGFKSVNDQHGHAAGDELLVGVTQGLTRILRGNDTLARLGGDEFVLLLSDIESPGECTLILDRVLRAVCTPVNLNQGAVSVSASIGVSLFPEDNADADTLLRHADQAMYIAKDAGKNRYHLFDPASDRKAQFHRDYLARLRQALDQDEYVLHYQPKVNLITGALTGVEALIRWRHPERGLVPPGEFLRHIDGSDLEIMLGNWVIDTALAQATAWAAQGTPVAVSVNVSANHLLHEGFHASLMASLARFPAVPPGQFELEVLETAAIGDMDQAADVLTRCHALGVKFALDDFGTGYSSLTYLRKLPADTLKIDQSFVRDMLIDAEDMGIVDGVIRLASAFKRSVIAEGVETMQHGAELLRMGCHLAQGYGVARPMPAPDVLPWLQQWRQEAPWLKLLD